MLYLFSVLARRGVCTGPGLARVFTLGCPAGGVRGRPAAGTARAQVGIDARAAQARRTAAAHDAAAAAAAGELVEVAAEVEADLAVEAGLAEQEAGAAGAAGAVAFDALVQ